MIWRPGGVSWLRWWDDADEGKEKQSWVETGSNSSHHQHPSSLACSIQHKNPSTLKHTTEPELSSSSSRWKKGNKIKLIIMNEGKRLKNQLNSTQLLPSTFTLHHRMLHSSQKTYTPKKTSSNSPFSVSSPLQHIAVVPLRCWINIFSTYSTRTWHFHPPSFILLACLLLLLWWNGYFTCV
jgi:hypothetical protein